MGQVSVVQRLAEVETMDATAKVRRVSGRSIVLRDNLKGRWKFRCYRSRSFLFKFIRREKCYLAYSES